MFSRQDTIAIVGFGRFGQLLTQILLEHTSAQIVVISSQPQSLHHARLQFGKIHEVNTATVVIPCVPIRVFKSQLQQLLPHLSATCVVIDVCSVKVKPVGIMQEILPDSIQIIATHPMFGPDSVAHNNGLQGLKIVVSKVRVSTENWETFVAFWREIGVTTIELSPEEHDRQAAWSMAYFSLIGRVGLEIGIKSTTIDTPWFQKLLTLQSVVAHDTPQLFQDMQTCNPFAKEMRTQVADALHKINQELDPKE